MSPPDPDTRSPFVPAYDRYQPRFVSETELVVRCEANPGNPPEIWRFHQLVGGPGDGQDTDEYATSWGASIWVQAVSHASNHSTGLLSPGSTLHYNTERVVYEARSLSVPWSNAIFQCYAPELLGPSEVLGALWPQIFEALGCSDERNEYASRARWFRAQQPYPYPSISPAYKVSTP